MTNLYSVLKSKDITLQTKVLCIVLGVELLGCIHSVFSNYFQQFCVILIQAHLVNNIQPQDFKNIQSKHLSLIRELNQSHSLWVLFGLLPANLLCLLFTVISSSLPHSAFLFLLKFTYSEIYRSPVVYSAFVCLFVFIYLFCFCIFKKSIYLAVLNVSCGTWDFSALTRDDIARCRGPLGKSELPSFLKPHTFHCVYVYTTFWLFIHLLMDACIALCS